MNTLKLKMVNGVKIEGGDAEVMQIVHALQAVAVLVAGELTDTVEVKDEAGLGVSVPRGEAAKLLAKNKAKF